MSRKNYEEDIKVTIIMSVFNNELYLEDAIKSVLNQSYSNFEFLITDDASSDRSRYILEKYKRKDKRIKLFFNHKNLGLTKNLNNMIDIAQGELIARMDGDDICFLDRLKKQVDILKKEDVDIVFSGTMLIDHEGKELCEGWRPKKLKKILKIIEIHNYIPHPTVMMKKDIMIKNKYNENYITGQDKELWGRLVEDKYIFHYIKEPLLYYRINPNSVRVKRKKSNDYRLASIYISNRHKLLVFSTFNKLSLREKVLISCKLLLPYQSIYLVEFILLKYRQVNKI
ncbi:glycosyltransferase family 2 protein [Enterococcus sp. LJL98]